MYGSRSIGLTCLQSFSKHVRGHLTWHLSSVHSILIAQDLLLAPERYLGIYIGTMTVCALFWLCSLRTGIVGKFEAFGSAQGEDSQYSRSMKPGSILDLKSSIEMLNIGGLSGSTDDYGLFLSAAVALSLSALLWVYLVWIATDPGAVRSRITDFDMVSAEVRQTGHFLCSNSASPA